MTNEEILNKIQNGETSEKEMIKWAKNKKTILFLLENNIPDILQYITEPNLLFISIDGKSNVLEKFFENKIMNSEKMEEIKNTIEFHSGNIYLIIKDLINKKILTVNELTELTINNPYTNLYIEANIILYIKIEYGLDLLQQISKNLTVLDYLIICELDGFNVKNEASCNKDIAEKYLFWDRYSVLMRCNNDIILSTFYNERKNILDYYVDYIKASANTLLEFPLPKDQKILLNKKSDSEDNYIDSIIKILKDKNCLHKLKYFNFDFELLFYKSKYLNGLNLIDYLLKIDTNSFIKKLFNKYQDDIKVWVNKVDNDLFFLQYLINKNKDILSLIKENKRLKCNPTVVLLLNKLNPNIKLEIDNDLFDEDFFEEKRELLFEECYKEYYDGEIEEKYKQKIDYFRSIMLEDNLSDVRAVDFACNAFKAGFICNYKYAEKDIDNAINIKLNDHKFSIKISDEIDVFSLKRKPSFDIKENTILVNSTFDIDTFNHEFAHAVHYNFNGGKPPKSFENYDTINEDAKKRAIKFFKKLLNEDYMYYKSDSIKKINDVLKKFSIQIIESDYSKFFERVKENLKTAFDNYHYSDDVLSYLAKSIIDKNGFKQKYISYTSSEIELFGKEIKLVNPYKVCDIIDAVTKGNAFSEGLIDEGGDVIKSHAGHGKKYYDVEDPAQKAFTEIYALYIELLKSPYSEFLVNEIKYIFGEEFIEMLEEFDKEMVIKRIKTKRK